MNVRSWLGLVAGIFFIASVHSPLAVQVTVSAPPPTSRPEIAVASPAPSPSPDLKDREIQLLKARLAADRKAAAQDKIRRIVYETELQVAALRKFPVHSLVKYAPLTPAVLDAMFDEGVDKQYPDAALEQWTWLEQLFGALPPGYNVKTQMRKLLGEQVAGLYDPHSEQLFVSEDMQIEGGMGRMVLAHEITHGFQDQNFELLKLGIEMNGDDDHSLAISSIAEGDATLAMAEYMAQTGQFGSLLFDLPKMMMMDQHELDSSPASVQMALVFPYMNGMAFFEALNGRTRQHPNGVANPADPAWRSEVFANPPSTTAQILHVEKYLKNQRPAEIKPFRILNKRLASTNVMGEAGVGMLLDPALRKAEAQGLLKEKSEAAAGDANPKSTVQGGKTGAPAAGGKDESKALAGMFGSLPQQGASATRAADGWNGDRVLIEDNPGNSGEDGVRRLTWKTQWDTPKDAQEFYDAVRAGLEATLAPAHKESDAQTATLTGEQGEVTVRRTGEKGVDVEGKFKLKK